MDRRLRAVALMLPVGAHSLVVGPTGSGKSTALATVAATVAAAMAATTGQGPKPDGAVTVISHALSPLAGLDGVGWIDHADADGLAARWDDSRGLAHFVLVDDVELLSEPVAAVLAQMTTERDGGLHVVAAGRPEIVRSSPHFSAPFRTARTGILLQPSPLESDIFRTTLPAAALAGLGPGRGLVVTLGVPVVTQIAWDRSLLAPKTG
jgi:S-DNA-T family DNA segregation ATPase FtsK/SpoIIIE